MESLLGNESVRARLWRAADQSSSLGRMHHCYVFEGPEGVGKATTAMRLALTVNCLGTVDSSGAPCGTCASCRQILAGTHPDILVVTPDPDRATRVITADQARGIISSLQLQRHSARRRFVILDPADALTEEAANVLLKTFEEPPAGTQFILVTARAASLLTTVRSRSQRVRFGPVSRAELEAWLHGRRLDPALAVLSGGSPGYALRLAEGEAQERREAVVQLLATVGQPLHQLFAFTEAAGKKSDGSVERTTLAVDALEELLRDAVFVASGREHAALHQVHLDALSVWASALYPGGIGRMEKAIAAARDRLKLNVNGRVVLEALLSVLNLELSQARRQSG